MTLHKEIGSDAYNTETGDGLDDVSYTPEEVETDVPEEMSDAQRLDRGEIEVDDGKDEIFVDPNATFGKQTDEEEEQPAEEEEKPAEEKEEEVKAGEEDDKKPEKEVKKEVKKKTGEPSPEVVKLAKRYSQKRINKISREKFTLRDENEKLRKQLKELKGKSREADLIKKKAEHTSKKPKAEDFASDAEFYEALGRWSAKDEIYEHEASQPVVEEEPTAEEQQQLTFENIRDRIITDGEDKYDDFAEIVLKTDGSIVITPEMVLAAGDSDNAADIFYYLGQNPEESHRIARLQGNQIAREMGRIESQFLVEVEEHLPEEDSELLEKAKKKKQKPKEKPKTPPEPVKPLGGGGRVSVDLDKAGIDDFITERGYTRDGGGNIMKKRANS